MALSEKQVNKKVKENIKNIPNLLTLMRVILSFVLIYIVFNGASLWTIAIVFAIAALTDAADGYIARRFKMETNFGRVFDITADRILMISIIIALISYLLINGSLTSEKLIMMILIMSREIISAPFFIISLFLKKGRPFPHVRLIGKITTASQGVTFPVIILGWSIDLYLSVVTCAVGAASGIFYAYDSIVNPKKG